MNVKNFGTARKAVLALQAQIATETKADPRLARTKRRCDALVAAVDMAERKYSMVMGRKVPAKVADRKAGVKKAPAKKRVKKTAVVVDMPMKAPVAAARKRQAIKRSK